MMYLLLTHGPYHKGNATNRNTQEQKTWIITE